MTRDKLPTMGLRRFLAPALLLLAAPLACDDDSSKESSSGSTGGTTSTGGAPTQGSGGTTTTTGGTTATGGDGGGPTQNQTVPSAGCGKTESSGGAREMEVSGHTGRYIVSLPPNYDPNHPYPLGFAFHGRNRNHENCQAGDCAGFQSALGDQAVLVYMQSLRTPASSTEGGWEGDGEREGNVTFFEQVRDTVLDEFCIDEKRVFVAGTSSGAHFVNVLGCRFGDELLAIAPVAGYLPEQNCKGYPAALVIHGVDDNLQTGETARDFWVNRNGCSTTTEPPLQQMHDDIRAKRDANPSVEDHGCVDYQGCTQQPVRWCEHSYGGYDNSTHGWPPTGGQMIREFLETLD